ncbi:MAG TPA: putative lipid II flippase FtsW [Candidatus Eremiobacteraeota bacterium]|nr:putative lipid II flippase FtsW [Candidatus Eremiobacteraeota bacterium]
MDNIEKDVKLNKGQNLDWRFFIVTIVLVSFGLIMVYSSSSVEASTSSSYNYNGYYFFIRQMRGVLLGFTGIFIITRLRLEFIKKMSLPFVLLSIILLALVLFIGVERNGSKRWLELAGFSLQPSELCKLSLVLFMSSYLSESKKKVKSFWLGVFPLLFLVGIIFLLIEMQPDLGTIIAIGLIFMFMLYIAGTRAFHLISIFIIGLGIGIFQVIEKPYRMARMMSFVNPWKDPESSGFQIIQSLLALGSGGLWGMGIGQSRQKLFYLPEQHTDFIFAIIGEELGFAGCLFTIMLFLIFIYSGFRIALSRKDSFSFLLAAGLTGSIAIQAFVNMSVASGLLPLTGMTLPFISFGSTSMIVSLCSVGLVLKISASPPLKEPERREVKLEKSLRKISREKTYNKGYIQDYKEYIF